MARLLRINFLTLNSFKYKSVKDNPETSDAPPNVFQENVMGDIILKLKELKARFPRGQKKVRSTV